MTEEQLLSAMREWPWPICVKSGKESGFPEGRDNRLSSPPDWIDKAIRGGLVIASSTKYGTIYQLSRFASKKLRQ